MARAARALGVGLLGTAAMTGYQELVGRLRGGGGSAGSWADAPAPAKVARLALEPLLGGEPPVSWIGPLTNATHWGYGTFWGAAFSLARPLFPRSPLAAAAAFGGAVWALSYAQLVPLGIYEPPWRYPPAEIALDLSYHLAFGLGVAGADALLGQPM